MELHWENLTAPGFAKVRIEPHLGKLNDLTGSMPHPKGDIAVSVKRTAARVNAHVVLPPDVVEVKEET